MALEFYCELKIFINKHVTPILMPGQRQLSEKCTATTIEECPFVTCKVCQFRTCKEVPDKEPS